MLSAGTNIQMLSENMTALPVEQLYQSLLHPKPEVLSRVKQLRIMRQVDIAQYNKNKKLLPYFVCGVFNPTVRRTENFAYTSYFVVDLDKLSEKQWDVENLRGRLELDNRVLLSFVSPSEDGLKLMFRLKDRCYDAGIYKVFYRAFVHRFSAQYHLEQVADTCTCDVCRACFLSVDEHAYYNPQADPVDIKDYLTTEDPASVFDLKREQDQRQAEEKAVEAEKTAAGTSTKEPDSDELSRVKEFLKMKKEKPMASKMPVYVPERLEQIMTDLRQFVDDQGIEVYETLDIQYGKKLRLRQGNRLAEVNLFYGKRGFSVVQVPRPTLSAELNEVSAELINVFFQDLTD